jgi:hypothetical protein
MSMGKAIIWSIVVLSLFVLVLLVIVLSVSDIGLSPKECDVTETAFSSAVHQLKFGEECALIKSQYGYLEGQASANALNKCRERTDRRCEVIETSLNSNEIGLDSKGMLSCLVRSTVVVSSKSDRC